MEGILGRLGVLQSAMLVRLCELGGSPELHRDVLGFQTLVKCAVSAFNQCNRYCKLRWRVDARRVGAGDALELIEGSWRQFSAVEVAHYERLLELVNWCTQFQLALLERSEQQTVSMNNQVDQLRDECIREHSVAAAVPAETTTTKTTNLQQGSSRDQLLSKTKRLTSNLIKSNQMLQSGVLQSDLNLDELRGQTASLNKLEDKYGQFELVFHRTAKLVKTLESASNQERRNVYMALGFLCLAVSWVLWRRIFKMPTKLALWLMFKFFRGVLVSAGVVRRTMRQQPIAIAVSASASASGTTTSSASTITDSIENAVSEAVDRLFTHDEL
ncbi:Sec20p KNAG_0K02220 [Huiozyma naganishii CBS 8797]|uniref:Sec20 C-terminal domain-containing protein n=1 Tax=Huiozyma naganishii (strain ATCC MYA-139 / BCRC 22969 / CBS 8797 / KCTC 17520 / NBRC 10181 / NCYC 3082 / Yp74L-3) TaxID=1071383 RepID=J7RCJ2_HUIN7|nr:hypothetical protein KNAG_0K02220 [Kazachstania naganishii CBS 8797]CCK72585.1 hypothetical protein KNAG_0K02220 [Kazachstania naganishii CBS 8797]